MDDHAPRALPEFQIVWVKLFYLFLRGRLRGRADELAVMTFICSCRVNRSVGSLLLKMGHPMSMFETPDPSRKDRHNATHVFRHGFWCGNAVLLQQGSN